MSETLRPTATAAAAKPAVTKVGGGFMLSREVKGRAEALGLDHWSYYFAGRCGVLGPVHADVVRAAAGFFPAGTVARCWESALAVIGPFEAANDYAQACQAWGRRRLADLPEPEKLAVLLEKVTAAADPAGVPLFAGWRALPLPEDGPARVAQLLHVLREHRGGLHLLAVLAAGLTPLQAVVAGPYGPTNARFFDWPEPHPEPTDAWRALHARAEDTTDALAGRAYAVLDAAERAELVERLADALRAAFPDTTSQSA
ncbi:MAG: SCO6745 family protein [Motilibacteraceae bacterium]